MDDLKYNMQRLIYLANDLKQIDLDMLEQQLPDIPLEGYIFYPIGWDEKYDLRDITEELIAAAKVLLETIDKYTPKQP